MATLKPGDRIAYTAKFLNNTAQHTGAAPERRGTYVGPYAGLSSHSRVHWDDEADRIASKQGQYAEQDYCDDVAHNGSLVCTKNIARADSPRLNDL